MIRYLRTWLQKRITVIGNGKLRDNLRQSRRASWQGRWSTRAGWL